LLEGIASSIGEQIVNYIVGLVFRVVTAALIYIIDLV
jgi:hypothetical protein